jgi:DNA-binding transcriptional LysR family regulator
LLRWADQVVPMSSMDGNDTLLRSAAGAGNGIAALPEAMLRENIATGNVVPVLNDCSTTDGDLELCRFYAHRQLLPARFRSFIDFCTAFFRENDSHRQRNVHTAATEQIHGNLAALAAA